MTHAGTEEAELGGLADDESDFGARHVGLGPFFHAERHDAEGVQRSRSPGNRGAGGLDADVIGSCRAAADPHAAPLFGSGIVRRTAGDGAVEIGIRFERLHATGIAAAEPGAEHVEHAMSQDVGPEYAAVEQHPQGPSGRVRVAGDPLRR